VVTGSSQLRVPQSIFEKEPIQQVFTMNEPIITCPNCKTEIKLNESLAAPLIEATRLQFEHTIAEKEAQIAKREAAVSVSKSNDRKSKRSNRRSGLGRNSRPSEKKNRY